MQSWCSCRERATEPCAPMTKCRSGRRLHIAGTTSASKSMPLRGTRRLKATIVLSASGVLQSQAALSLHRVHCLSRMSAISHEWAVLCGGQAAGAFGAQHGICHTLALLVPGPHAGLRSGEKLSAWMALGMTVTRLGGMQARSTVFSLAVCDTQITCRRMLAFMHSSVQ